MMAPARAGAVFARKLYPFAIPFAVMEDTGPITRMVAGTIIKKAD